MNSSELLAFAKVPLLLAVAAVLTGCVNASVDEMVFNEPTAGIGDSSVVILGRRHASDVENRRRRV